MYQNGDRSPLVQPLDDVPLIQNYEPKARGNFTEENDLEERRLGHVGVTRARKKLYITCIRYLAAKYNSH
jgi:superfamily I DNA/RNA helicase